MSSDLDLPVSRFLAKLPAVRAALREEDSGLADMLADEEFLASAGPFLRMGTLLDMRGLDRDRVLAQAREQARATAGLGGMLPLEQWAMGGDGPRVFLSLPCPLKVPVMAELERLHAAHARTGFRVYLDSCGRHTLNDLADQLRDPDEVPDVVISAGLNSFLSLPFQDRFTRTGLMASIAPPLDGSLAQFREPTGAYAVYAVNPLVIVAVKSRLKGRPVPRSWERLLDPAYAGDVGLCGEAESAGDSTALLHYHGRFGPEGVRRFARTVACNTHPSQILRPMPGAKAPALGVMPLFFARSAPRQDDVEIVWPEEGGLVSPLFVLAKAERLEETRPLLDFFLGEPMARVASGAHMPALFPGLPGTLPPEARLSWIGWDVVASRDVGALCREAGRVFLEAYQAK